MDITTTPLQSYLDAYWNSESDPQLDRLWEALTTDERFFIEMRGLAPWQNN